MWAVCAPDSGQQLDGRCQRESFCPLRQSMVVGREGGRTRAAGQMQRVSEFQTLVEGIDRDEYRVAILKRDVFDARERPHPGGAERPAPAP